MLRGAAARLALAGALAASLAVGAYAQGRVPVVRDAEIEALVREYAKPILKAAGLSNQNIEIILVNDARFNAFVTGRKMFINTGALMQAETPNEIIGVIAHEAGHIAGGHQQRLRQQLERAQTMAVVAGLLGMGAIAAGAATKTEGLGQVGAGVVAGGAEAARRGLLNYQRSEEVTADRSALTYLERTGQSAKGMLKTFGRFQSTLSLSGARVDPYLQSHPMPRDRIANLETLARESAHFDKPDSPALQARHDMMRAKIAVFTQEQGLTARLFRNDPGGAAALYADAISTYLRGNPAAALKKTDAMIKAQPKNPYLRELRGDILMKANKPEAAAEAYQSALSLDPNKSSMLQLGYAQALIATGEPASLKKAATAATKALDRDKSNVAGYRLLAQAHGLMGDVAEAELATAEEHFHMGAHQDAKIFAARAQQKFKRGSPGWLRAQDIINFRAPKKK
ncbi:MAG TPA: M48 family metalloprotease [Mesorhizobium sp.]|jgi:predicted Zn-dependent protease|nr:M48 family metalloprotease [Mesorhizobium sp.]